MRVGARGASALERAERARRSAEPAGGSGFSSWSASRGAEPSGPARGGLVPRVAARQPSALGGAGRPPLRWGFTASNSLSHAETQRILSCRAAWRVLSLRSVRATYQESEKRRHGAKIHLSNPTPGHAMGRSGRSGARRGGEGGGAGKDGTPSGQSGHEITLPPAL